MRAACAARARARARAALSARIEQLAAGYVPELARALALTRVLRSASGGGSRRGMGGLQRDAKMGGP